MTKLVDLTGATYGRLTVLRRDTTRTDHEVYWVCRCSCGKKTSTRGSLLKSGKTQSCGCLRRERISEEMRRYHYEKKVVGS